MKDFIQDNYLIMMLVIAFLIFALIGYLIDATRKGAKKEIDEDENESGIPAVTDVNNPKAEPEQNVILETQENIPDINEPETLDKSEKDNN